MHRNRRHPHEQTHINASNAYIRRYKTYQNRYRDWLFPLDRTEREQVVREIFAWTSTQEDYISPGGANGFQNRQMIRPIQPLPSPQSSSQGHSPAQVMPNDFLIHNHLQQPSPGYQAHWQNRASVSTTSTLPSAASTHSTHSSYNTVYDDTFSSHRASIATTNSSLSAASFQVHQQQQHRKVQLAKHDPVAGLWNGSLRVIPCGKNHSALSWEEPFSPCSVCGFSRWHSLMLHAGSIGSESLASATMALGDIPRVDFAGNYPIHYLMSAGVGFEFFSTPFQWDEGMPQNVFGQNPLHALNPLGLGEQLIVVLEWFNARENPPGLLLTQRDINCRTPLHTILQHPLDRKMYQRILHVIPYAEFYLSAPDSTGRTTVKMMNKAAMRVQMESPADYARIQDGITDVKLFLSDAERAQNGNNRTYGFHDIARGARGVTNALFGYYQCLICNQYNAHANSYLAQLYCAFENGRDRNGPDETGITPAHALVTFARCNSDEERTPETPSQTAELFRFLIPPDDPRRGEALHALDPQGNNLVFNVATRGLDVILEYVLSLVEPSRRTAMVNACSRAPDGNSEWSVLMAVKTKLDEAAKQIHIAEFTHNTALKAVVKEKGKRLYRCKTILQNAGAELNPSVTTRWRIA